MKLERIEELTVLARQWHSPEKATISFAIRACEAVSGALHPDELLHLLRCARAVARLEAYPHAITLAASPHGMTVPRWGALLNGEIDSEGDLLPAIEAALERAEEAKQ